MTTPPALPSSNSDESTDRLLIIFCHLSLLLGVGLLLPLIVYLIKKQDSPLVAQHAREALNFHISVILYVIVALVLCIILVGFILLPVIGIGSVVLSILAAIRASEGKFYTYPLTLRFIS